ncbi:uncharacterized protein LOC108665201 [Hyalella azteca]|uniref:Uncharacterized protein LOC108665201 n=1 Tax=Hyalella azteca TaxID=294128 RepID=A0A8B7N1U7_HYAAZ|nr:uncharacterized protein LOC108665201 [Hyalella azteca]
MIFSVSVLLACQVLVALGDRHSPPTYGHSTPSYGKLPPRHPHSPPTYGPPASPEPLYGHCDPTKPPACAYNGTSYCLEDPEYPASDIASAISSDYIFAKKYSDVPDQSADDLVEFLTKLQEEAFDYAFYSGASTGHSPYDLTHWAGPEGYICPSDVAYATLRRARNVQGKWHVIVNDAHYHTQTVRLETCLYPGAACRALAPCYSSACTQKFVYHRLLSYDPCDMYKGLFIDVYQLPSVCSCHVPAH